MTPALPPSQTHPRSPQVIRAVHKLLMSLMSIFPTESANSTVASKYEELEALYAHVSKLIYEGLTNYDKSVECVCRFRVSVCKSACCLSTFVW